MLVKGARWRALGTQVFFLSAKLQWNENRQIYQPPSLGAVRAVTRSCCPRGTGWLHHFASVQPWLFLVPRMMRAIVVWVAGDTQLSSSSRADVCSSFVCSATSWLIKLMVGHHGVWAGSTRWSGL